MKQINNIAILILLLLWGSWLCLSVSVSDGVSEVPSVQQPAETSEELLHQEEQKRAVAWSEQTASQSIAAIGEETLYAALLLTCCFLSYQGNAGKAKASKVSLYFSSLTEQFRILPNAP